MRTPRGGLTARKTFAPRVLAVQRYTQIGRNRGAVAEASEVAFLNFARRVHKIYILTSSFMVEDGELWLALAWKLSNRCQY